MKVFVGLVRHFDLVVGDQGGCAEHRALTLAADGYSQGFRVIELMP